jgi:cytochrome c biogenesis protein CcmG, thiol:disulfide interchange protein DsbE
VFALRAASRWLGFNLYRELMRLSAVVRAVVLCGAFACQAKERPADEVFKPLAVGDTIPAFTVPTLAGDSVSVGGGVRQPVTLMNVWATWCGPCKAEFPELQALHVAYGSRGLRLIAVSIDAEGDAPVAASAKAMGATFLIGRDPADAVRGRFSAVGIPETWLISSTGRLLWKHTGAIPAGDASVRAAVEAALAQ